MSEVIAQSFDSIMTQIEVFIEMVRNMKQLKRWIIKGYQGL
ncbi:hypothetical protein [Helicobacter bilis]|nr:hypothetical protein [Helicobacter bilis]MDD7296237.1 hypothetical protein [Helicobacter bilis]MDY4400386.1 hypothetical protein [Helicobacter bilis]